MKKNLKKFVGMLVAVCLLFQLSAFVSVLADGIPDDLTGTSYLVVHSTTDDYSADELGGPSSISVKDPSNNTITPVGGVYQNVPEGSTVNITYVFHLESGSEETDVYYYTDSNYFDITLPEGISFTASTTSGTWPRGTWAVSADRRSIRVSCSSDVDGQLGIWGSIGFTGTFDDVDYDDEQNVTLTLGSQTVTFQRVIPPPPAPGLSKSGSYNPTTNTITWTVTVTPPTGGDLGGYTLWDTYGGGQAYDAGSFKVGGSAPAAGLDDSGNPIKYTFPAGTTAAQTVTYTTTPTTFAGETGASSAAEKSTFDNTARVYFDTTPVTDNVTASVDVNWISKNGDRMSASIARWTVTVSVPNGGTITGATITDTLPAGMELLDDETHDVTIKIGSGATTTVTSYSVSGGVLSYTVGTLTGTATLTYYTKVTNPDADLKDNETKYYANNAALSWNEMPSGSVPPKDATSAGMGSGTGIIGKSADAEEVYKYGDYIKWTITVNSNDINMTGVVIDDTVPAGQELAIDAARPFAVTGDSYAGFSTTTAATSGAFTYTDANHFSFTLGTISDTYTITYWTRIIDTNPASNSDSSGLDTLYSNGNASGKVTFGNSVDLIRTSDGDKKVTTSGTKTYQTQMIAKGIAAGYDYTTHLIKWTVTVNRNQLPLTTAKVTDTIPAGMALYIDAAHPMVVTNATTSATVETITSATGSTNLTSTDSYVNNFSYTIGSTSDTYTISYWSVMTDAQLATQWPGYKTFTNTATLTADQIKSPGISAWASTSLINPVVSKNYNYTAGNDYIDWTVGINPGLADLRNAYVADGLDAGLELDAASVKLYEVGVNAVNGTLGSIAGGTLIDAADYSVTLPTSANNNTLTVNLPDGRHAYILVFSTNIVDEDGTLSFTNTATLNGQTGSPSGTGDSGQFSVSNLWASGGSGSLSLTVHKANAAGQAVPGAVYGLYNSKYQPVKKNGVQITATTDANGDAVFRNLPSWTFYVKETVSPADYLLNETWLYGGKLTQNTTVNTTDAYAAADVSFTKTGTGGAALSGGSFTLSGTDAGGGSVSRTASADDTGTVTFEDVPVGSYTISEVTPPTGYAITASTISVTVAPNQTGTAIVVTTDPSPATLSNSLLLGTVSISKTDDGGNPLSGGSFTLAGTDFAGNAVNRTAVSDGGAVTFENVPLGSYQLYEAAPPTGYMLAEDVIYVTVSANPGHTAAVVTKSSSSSESVPVSAIENTLNTGDVSIRKTGLNGTVLKGGAFKLEGTDFNGEDVSMETSADDNGIIKFTDVPLGTYTISEITPPTGYYWTGETIGVTVTANATHSGVIVATTPDPAILANEIILGDFSFTKTDLVGTRLYGGQFTLTGTDFAGSTITKTASAVNGAVSFTDIPVGSYTIAETISPSGYYRTTETITVTVAPNGDSTQVVVTGSAAVLKNEPVPNDGTGTIELRKTDESGLSLAGATFGLYDGEGELVRSATSDENGVVAFTDVPKGSYTIRELEAPKGYIASQLEASATISANGQTVNASPYFFTNRKDKADAEIIVKKVDSATGAVLAGAEFTLYDADGAVVGKAVTGSDGTAKFSDLAAGTYTLKETAAPKGYVLKSESVSVTLKESQSYTLTVTNTKDTSVDDDDTPGGGTGGDDDNVPDDGTPGGGQLPQTGGFLSTATLVLMGALLIALGLVAAYTRKRKGHN